VRSILPLGQNPQGFCETGAPYIVAGATLQEKICEKCTKFKRG